jgi:hypothetical protein
VVRKLVSAIVVCLLFAGVGLADDILYATDGAALYTVDLATGTLTFQSDGPLRWIASPAFDEEHHTRFFWLQDCCADHTGNYTWGNPATGQTGNGAASASWSDSYSYPHTTPTDAQFGVLVYTPTIERLYTFATTWADIAPPGQQPILVHLANPMMLDQYDGPPVDGWGGLFGLGSDGDDWRLSSLAFDPTTGLILIGMNHYCEYSSPCGASTMWLDPTTGLPAGAGPINDVFAIWPGPDVGSYYEGYVQIGPMAVEPTTGDIYYILSMPGYDDFMLKPSPRLLRWDRALGKEFDICQWSDGAWSLRFASSKWIGQ